MQRRSYLSIQFIGIPSDTLYGIALGLWLLSGVAVLHPRTEELIASKFHHLRPPSALELQLLGPAWWQVCTSAGVNPDKFRLWIHEGPETTAPITVGNTIAVSHWSLYNLGSRHGHSPDLEAVLAHHLAMPRLASLATFWLSLPARITGAAIVAGLKNPVLSIVIKIVLGRSSLPGADRQNRDHGHSPDDRTSQLERGNSSTAVRRPRWPAARCPSWGGRARTQPSS
ncbi:hypothetical protein ACFPJ1_43080 [Kribbella qitaiheensis]|uniref:hypothetical protein n=1 Tax=Kribbella qitaiheensis TaxID=1544730 RepID=UPI00360C4280